MHLNKDTIFGIKWITRPIVRLLMSSIQTVYLDHRLSVTEARVDRPGTSSFADHLRVESRVHFNEQSGPFPSLFQVESVGGSFAVICTALHEETAGLIQNIEYTIVYYDSLDRTG